VQTPATTIQRAFTGSPLTKEIVAMERSRRREIPPQMSFERREEGMIWGKGEDCVV
jgi:hypothetical protein